MRENQVMAELRAEGYYWIKRNEPDGPPEWEPAKFAHDHYVPDGPVTIQPDGLRGQLMKSGGGPCWYLVGSRYPQREITTPGASNRWEVGAALDSGSLDLLVSAAHAVIAAIEDLDNPSDEGIPAHHPAVQLLRRELKDSLRRMKA